MKYLILYFKLDYLSLFIISKPRRRFASRFKKKKIIIIIIHEKNYRKKNIFIKTLIFFSTPKMKRFFF